MSNKDGILITNKNMYGLVNPPPKPSSKDGALPHQDISSAAVRWDTFVDLSNSGFSFTPANPTMMSIIDKIPYPSGPDSIFYPLYQACQITFTQTQTFSKIRLWLKGRTGVISGGGPSLYDQLPGPSIINSAINDANWAWNKILDPNHPDFGKANRDGMCNNDGTKRTPPPPLWSNWQKDTGIAHGITDLGHPNNLAPNTYDVWDISGPTTAADPTANGSTYELYENISPNGWNLAWNVIITETSPTGQMKFLNQKGTWQTGQTTTGIMFYYNPKAYALALGSSAANKLMGSNANYWVPPVTKNKTTGAKDNAGAASRYDNLVSASWVNIAPLPPCLDFYVIHSQTTKFVGTTSNVPGSNIGSNLWYCENRCGYQFIGSAGGFPPPPDAVQAWTDIPVTFKKDHSYLANVAMVNVATQIGGSPTTVGPGLANVDALTYLELIV